MILFGFINKPYHMSIRSDIVLFPFAGPGLVFEVFPAGLTLLPASPIWSVVFFIMLAFFAIDSAVRIGHYEVDDVVVSSLTLDNECGSWYSWLHFRY